jgi:hypothetical protein
MSFSWKTAVDTHYDEVLFSLGQYFHCALLQSQRFNNGSTAPVATNQNLVSFNTIKKVDSPRFLRLLLAD